MAEDNPFCEAAGDGFVKLNSGAMRSVALAEHMAKCHPKPVGCVIEITEEMAVAMRVGPITLRWDRPDGTTGRVVLPPVDYS